jgi:hypothetical protein
MAAFDAFECTAFPVQNQAKKVTLLRKTGGYLIFWSKVLLKKRGEAC